tara:strand:- start:1548 stop:2474 length:927 start_codon:yes stop_codon:yes gene_type:complete
MRLGFAGTPEFAAIILRDLIKTPHDVARILTQPARPTGRGRKSLSSAVQQEAERHGIVCVTPTNLRGRKDLVADLDLLVVAAYGMILPTEIFHGPQFASLNVHASLLPRWRGAAPIERAIMAGDSETGVSIMQIEKALDAGPLFALTHHPLSGDETGASLSKTLARIGSASLIEVLRDWSDLPKPSPQDHQRATYAYKLTPADSLISWTTPAVDIERIVRALSDRSAAYTTLGDNRIRILKVKVLEGSANPGELVKTNEGFAIGCADGLLLLDTVQLNRGQGKPMSADDAANGHADLFSTGIQYDVVG